MEIYVVQEGDTIDAIAERFGVAVDRLAYDNGLSYPYTLLIGQALIIAYPKQVHVVQEGDSLQSIAELYQVSLMQILRNNSFLSEREYIYPGETLVISYNTERSITTNGYVFAFIKQENLRKILPNLTYLSVFNYTAADRGEIIQYREDESIIKIALEYGVAPLLMVSTLTTTGEPDVQTAYSILLNEEYQDRSINQFVELMKKKGYYGINMVFNYLDRSSLPIYNNFVRKVSQRLKQEGFIFIITINITQELLKEDFLIEEIDYASLSPYVDGIIFLKFVWGANYDPPAPITNINYFERVIDFLVERIPSQRVMVGNPILGYDWQLPYIPNQSVATSMTLNAVQELAIETNSVIEFDEVSITPYFNYYQVLGVPVKHIVWFIDVRSINAINDIVKDHALEGSGIWNTMFYYPQLWTSINARFDIIKLIE